VLPISNQSPLRCTDKGLCLRSFNSLQEWINVLNAAEKSTQNEMARILLSKPINFHLGASLCHTPAKVPDAVGSQGAETVHITAEATGVYRLEVSSFEKAAQPGLYQAKLVDLRAATQADEKRLMARRAFDEGQRLQDQNTPDPLPCCDSRYLRRS